MDSSDDDVSSSPEAESVEKSSILYPIVRLSVAVLLPLIFISFLSFSIGFLAFLFGSFSVPTRVSLPSQCKIVSSNVDIRSSKICELGLLNYNTKNVFSPSEKRKFRCRYDYYWASIFKVQYKDQLSGQTRLALAEAPSEALPVHCRPSFSTAWLTKDKFKVNQSYDCWYTSSMSKVSIYDDDFFSCQANEPSTTEMLRRYYILFKEMLLSRFILRRGGAARFWEWETIAGIAAGFSTSLISITLLSLVQHIKSLPRIHRAARLLPWPINSDLLKRACVLVVYLSLTSLLVTEYSKRLGFPVAGIKYRH